jgi:hypothetical protein
MTGTALQSRSGIMALEKGEMRPLPDIGRGFVHVFYMPDQDWNIGCVDIQGPVKFARALVRRDLRERREMSEGDQLWLYRVRKQDQGFQAVYATVPQERHQTLHRQYARHPGGMALFDGVAVILGLIKRVRPGKTRGVILLARDTAVVGIGNSRDCHWLVRMAAHEGKAASVVERIRAEAAWRGLALDGIDLVRALVRPSDASLPGDVRQWPVRLYKQQGVPRDAIVEGQVCSDLESLLPKLPLSFCPVTREESLFRPLEKLEPLAWLGLAAASVAMFASGFWLREDALRLVAQTRALQAQTTASAALSTDELASLRQHPAWSDLSRLREMIEPGLHRPLAGEALRRLAEAMRGMGRIAEITITEQSDALRLEIAGGLSQGLDAGPVYQQILQRLAHQGFTIRERRLDLTPGQASFVLQADLTLDAAQGDPNHERGPDLAAGFVPIHAPEG